jgi:thiaminase
MKNNIKYKIVLLFVVINVVFVLSIAFYIYKESQKDQHSLLVHQENEKIETTLIKSTLLLVEHHKNILSGEYIDPQSYLAVVRDLSAFVKKSMLLSVQSYLKQEDGFVLSATSATDKEFKAQHYAQYESKAPRDLLKLLNQAYRADSLYEVYADNKVAVNFEINGMKYVIIATVDRIKSLSQFNYLYSFIATALFLLLLLVLLIKFILVPLMKEITEIDTVLTKLFSYILNSTDKASVVPVKRVSHSELLKLSNTINSNIDKILKKMDQDSSNLERDNQVLDEMLEALKPTHHSVFKQEIKSKGYRGNVNKLKNSINALMVKMDGILDQLNKTTQSYLNQNYLETIQNDEYRDKMEQLIESINRLGEKQSKYFLDQVNYLIMVDSDMQEVERYIDQNSYTLDDVLASMKKALEMIDADSKFAIEFDNIIKVIKQENRYVNDLLDKFGQKYVESISLANDFRDGIFDDEPQELLNRLNRVVKDSSVRDADAQAKLIEQVKNLTSRDLERVTDEDMQELLSLLIDELLKDVRYSLYLIESKVEKLVGDSSQRVSSFLSIKDLTQGLKDEILHDLESSQKIQKMLKKISNQTNDTKYAILDENHFKDQEKVNELLENRGEL